MNNLQELDTAIQQAQIEASVNTPEERMMLRYIELGTVKYDAEKEREAIKEEIEMSMADGESFSVGDKVLVWQYELRTTFDHESAIGCGDLSKEVWARHTKSTPIRKLVVRKNADEKAKAIHAQTLILQANASSAFDLLLAMHSTGDEDGRFDDSIRELLENAGLIQRKAVSDE